MATMMSETGTKVTVSIEDKARALHVFEIGEDGKLACTSGSDSSMAYVVTHDSVRATRCPCKAYGRCCHKQAVEWHLQAIARAIYVVAFNPNNIAE